MKIDISLDSAVYSLDAVKAACYRFLDKFAAEIELRENKILCHLTFDESMSEALVNANLDNLKKEALDQDLRIRLKAETEPVRNLILAHAFSKTGLIADE
jgi:His-Xaa-Ser system protein HxsD